MSQASYKKPPFMTWPEHIFPKVITIRWSPEAIYVVVESYPKLLPEFIEKKKENPFYITSIQYIYVPAQSQHMCFS